MLMVTEGHCSPCPPQLSLSPADLVCLLLLVLENIADRGRAAGCQSDCALGPHIYMTAELIPATATKVQLRLFLVTLSLMPCPQGALGQSLS